MPSTRRGNRTRRHLIERSAEVFDRNGFKASTLDQMVRAAGFTRGAFYFHFDSKDALAEAIVVDQRERWTSLLENVRASEPDPLRGLVALNYGAAALHQSDTVMRAASRLLGERVLIARELPEAYPWWVATLRAFLGRAAEAGQLRDAAVGPGAEHRNLDELASYLVSTWHGNQQQTVAGRVDLATQLRTGWRLFLSAICRSPYPLTALLALNDELSGRLRTDAAGLARAFASTETDADSAAVGDAAG